MAAEYCHYGDPTSVGVCTKAAGKTNGYMPTALNGERFVKVAGSPEHFADALMLQREAEGVIKEHWSITGTRSGTIHIVSVKMKVYSSGAFVNALRIQRALAEQKRDSLLQDRAALDDPKFTAQWKRAKTALEAAERCDRLCMEKNDVLIRDDL